MSETHAEAAANLIKHGVLLRPSELSPDMRELAADAQAFVHAMLAVAEEIRALREAITTKEPTDA